MVTVRTSSLCWRIIPRVASTSSVRCNGVSFGVVDRPHADRAGLARGQEDVLVLDVRLEPEVAAEPLELGADGRGREVGGEERLHDQREPRAVGPRVQVDDVHPVRGQAAGDPVDVAGVDRPPAPSG